MNELIIDETNFKEYFRDCRTSRPERDDVMARWMARAELVDGVMKRDIIDLLLNKDKALAATKVMQRLAHATYESSIKVCKEICEDLESGMTFEEVEAKSYPYDIEMFYYTKKEYVPFSDPHWCIIGIENLDEFLDKDNNRFSIKSRIVKKTEVVNDH